MKALEKFAKKFEKAMSAVAFAEAGEADEARRVMKEGAPAARTKGRGAGRPVDMRLRPQGGR
jgi:hypothetical protein